MRNRSSAISITTSFKKRISQEINESENLTEAGKQIKFGEIIEKDLKEKNQIKPLKPFMNNNIIDLPTPQYLDIKKEYYTKDEKVNFLNFFHLNNFYYCKLSLFYFMKKLKYLIYSIKNLLETLMRISKRLIFRLFYHSLKTKKK